MAFPPKKKKPDFALLMEEEPEAAAPLDEEEDEGDFGDLPDDPDEEESLAAMEDLGDEVSEIDPEQAALCERLGFTDPDQQQALIDLVRLVNTPDPMATESSNSLPSLPESTY